MSPGDIYRYAFVTSTTRDATSTNIDDYNAFVQAAADATGSLFAGSGITWFAIASTSIVSASDNIGGGLNSAIYLPNGSLLATGDSQLWSTGGDTPLEITEKGGVVDVIVWTGTNRFGSGHDVLGSTEPAIGYSNAPNEAWIADQPASATDS
jgi:hypothetical protein